MQKLFLTLIFSTFFAAFSFSQTRYQFYIYKTSFDEMIAMIKDEKPVDFKRAVFLVENAHYDNTFDYSKFCAEIDFHVEKIKQLIKAQPADVQKFKTIKNWAIFVYMTTELPENDYKPFLYDFDHFLQTENAANGFVTKLLKTKKGNCQSLPYLYKILANEIGAEAYLAFAPMHCYIKHKDEEGKWRNIELTNGSIARDVWIIQSSGVTAEQIASGLYMRACSKKEHIAQCVADLMMSYDKRFMLDLLTLPMIDTALSYFPKNFLLLIQKINSYDIFLRFEKKSKNPDNELINSYTAKLNETNKQLDDLGYVDGDLEKYKQWAKTEGRKMNDEIQEKRRKERMKQNAKNNK
ncbi:MAG: hypothetical protein LBB53_01305 [Prevotellaceae bacterium]|jgi:hypothetical protein|nr:hypothetical protein [Prevotellaceae bacterium]